MVNRITRILFRRYVAKRMSVSAPLSLYVDELDLEQYVQELLLSQGLLTVGDVLEAYSLHVETPGVGKRSWMQFFEACR